MFRDIRHASSEFNAKQEAERVMRETKVAEADVIMFSGTKDEGEA